MSRLGDRVRVRRRAAEDGVTPVPRPEAWLVATAWLTVTASQLALSLSREKTFAPITSGPRPVAPWVDLLTTAADAVLLLACAASVLLVRRDIRWREWPTLLLLLAPWLVLSVRGVVLGEPPGLAALTYVALAGALWAVRPRLSVIEVVGLATGALAVLSLVLGIVVPWAGTYEGAPGQEAEKLIGPWGVLAGPLPTGNNLGRALALGLPAVLAIRDRRLRYASLGAVLLALVWTFSRTSWAAAAVVGLLALLLTAAARSRVRRAVPVLAWAALGGIAAVGLVLPFVTTDRDAFNHRGWFWSESLDHWREQPILGHGATFYAQLAESSDNLGGFAYHAHSLTVQLLVTGGVVLGLAVAGLVAVAAVRAVRLAADGVLWPVLFLAAVLTTAILEVPLSFVDNGKANLPALLPLLVLLCTRDVTGRRPSTQESGGPVPDKR